MMLTAVLSYKIFHPDFGQRETPLRKLIASVHEENTASIRVPPGTFAAYLFDCDGTVADSMPI